MMHLERVGGRVLICAAVIAVLAGIFYASRSPAQGVSLAPDTKQPGRYQIFMHPQFRSDQYLLDTATGQVWQLVKFGSLEGEPTAWSPMAKLDNEADRRAFIAANRLQRSPEAPATTSRPAKPTVGPPKSLNPQ